MSPRHEPPSSRRGGESSRDRSGESRRRGGSRHSVARTDPLYWARARAAEHDPFGRAPDDRSPFDQDPYDRAPFGQEEPGSEAATEEFPRVDPDWSGRLPLPLPPGRPRPQAWSADDRRGVEDATTDSLPVVRPDPVVRPEPDVRPGDAATTVDLPAVDALPSADLTETVDYRDRPLAVVPRSDRSLVPRPDRSTLARRNYTGRHRPPETVAPVRLGLSTVGMTVAVGVLGVTLAMLHAQPSDQVDSSTPPLAAVSPTGTPEPGTTPGADGTSTDGPQPTPGPRQQLIPRPGATSASADPADRPGTPAVAPDAPAAGGDVGGGNVGGGNFSGGDEPSVRNTPARPSRPTRTSRPDTAPRPTPRCAAPQLATSARALAADATTDVTTQADPTDEPDESSETPEEPTEEEASPSTSPGRC